MLTPLIVLFAIDGGREFRTSLQATRRRRRNRRCWSLSPSPTPLTDLTFEPWLHLQRLLSAQRQEIGENQRREKMHAAPAGLSGARLMRW